MTIIDKIEIDEKNGCVSVRFIKSNGGYHRCVFPVERDLEKQLKAINEHLERSGNLKIKEDDLNQNLIVKFQQLKNNWVGKMETNGWLY